MTKKKDPFDFLDAPPEPERREPPPRAEIELDWGGRAPREVSGGQVPVAYTVPVRPPPRPDGGDPLMAVEALKVRQVREWVEVLAGWETQNRYEVSDPEGRPLFFVGEMGSTFWDAVLRNFWAFRTVHLEFRALDATVALVVRKPWTFFFARAEVTDGHGRPLGVVRQRFKLFGRRLEILSPSGGVLAEIDGPLLHPWTFHVRRRETEIATISKRWGGVLRELFTDADSFGVHFLKVDDPTLRRLVLAATMLIDLAYFENRKRGGGIALLGD